MSKYATGFIGFSPLESAQAIDDLGELIALKEKNREQAENVRGYEIERDRTYDKLLKKPLDDVLAQAFLLRDNRVPLKHLEAMKQKNDRDLVAAQARLAATPGDVVIAKEVDFYQFNGALLDKKIKLETMISRRDKSKNAAERNALEEELKRLIPDIQEDEKRVLVDYPEFNTASKLSEINAKLTRQEQRQTKQDVLDAANQPAVPFGAPMTRGDVLTLPSAKDLPGSPKGDFVPGDPAETDRRPTSKASPQIEEIFDARNATAAVNPVKDPKFKWFDKDDILLGDMAVVDTSLGAEFGPVVWCSQSGMLAEGRSLGTNFTFWPFADGKQSPAYSGQGTLVSGALVYAMVTDQQSKMLENVGKAQLKQYIESHIQIFGKWGRQFDEDAFSGECPIRSASLNNDYREVITEIVSGVSQPKTKLSKDIGSGARKPAAKKKADIKKEIAMKVGPDGEYGDLIIDLQALYNTGRIVARKKGEAHVGGAVLNEVAGEGLVGLLTKRVMKNTLAKANPATLKQLERLRKLAASPTKATIRQPRGGQVIVSDGKDLAQRLKVATGIYDAGNRSAKNVELITELANALMKKGRMSPEKYRQTLERYTVK